MVLYGGLGQMI